MDSTHAYGIAAFLTQSDGVGKGALAVLLAMSLATWYLILAKAAQAVLEARSGLQALEIAHKTAELVHLLVADVTLPRMTGPALAEAVQDRMPAVRTLFATSRGSEEIERQGLRPEDVLRLDRTVDPRRVLQRIRESLSAQSAQ